MDALELLMTDHQRVKDLFKEVESSQTENKQRVIFETIKREIQLHAYIEENIFYPTFAKFDEFKDIVAHSLEEHKEVHQLLQQISQLKTNAGQLKDKLFELRDKVEHHVQEEEGKFFPRVRQLMKRGEREQLGRHLQTAKQEKEEQSEAA